MNKIIEFFLERARLNYLLFLFLVVFGIVTYQFVPKELFPPIALDKITIQGSYIGASANSLDKMAVTNIEDRVVNISGVKKVESLIQSNSFTMTLTLDKNINKNDVLNRVKDAISLTKVDLPSDMDEPSAILSENKIPLIQISVGSNSLTKSELLEHANRLKSEISLINNLTDIMIYGDSDAEFRLEIDTKKLEAYSLSKTDIVSALSQISNIFPIGRVEDSKHFFVSSKNENLSEDELANTILKISNKKIYLKDIATVKQTYADEQILSNFNGVNALSITISKAKEGDAIALVKVIKDKIKDYQSRNPTLVLESFFDTSIYIKNRLDTVISNITLGLLLVTLSMYILINRRIAFVVFMGLPTVFLMGIIFFYLSDLSINMISLLGALIAVGILVDDSIIVSENIQRYITMGYSPKDASVKGTKEVANAVIASALTTIFAFMPMLLLSGEMGSFIKMIPLAISFLIFASLLESFIFLPIHSRHFLRKDDKELDWTKFENLYVAILSFILKYKKIMLVAFLIFTITFTIIGFKNSKFQLFPDFDAAQVFVSGEVNINSSVKDTHEIAKAIEATILTHKDELYFDNISTLSGFKIDSTGKGENGENLFYMVLELKKLSPQNFLEEYINPYLIFDFSGEKGDRPIESVAIEAKLREILKDTKEKYGLEEFDIISQRAGVVKSDIEIAISFSDNSIIETVMNSLEANLSQINGVFNITNSAKMGIAELKIDLNEYGKRLGLTQGYIATTLNRYYLEGAISKSFNKDGIVDIIVKDSQKDVISNLKNFYIDIPNSTQKVALRDVVNFIEVQNYSKIIKENSKRLYSVYANVNSKTITANEVIKELSDEFETLKQTYGVEIGLKGEKEQNDQLKKDMSIAFLVALFLMFITLVIMFDSYIYPFMIISVIPLSILGVLGGHFLLNQNLTMPSIIGILGLAGVVVNGGIIMLEFIKDTKTNKELLDRARLRVRPVFLTTATTFIGLTTLIFFATGQAKVLQPLAISLGFGLIWGTILNLYYIPLLYRLVNYKKFNM